MGRSEIGVETQSIKQDKAIPLSALAGITAATMDDVELAEPGADLELERFMNEPVTIVVSADGTPGTLKEFDLNVNGFRQRIFRGRKQEVKRFFVESLARSRVVDYEQVTTDPSDLTSLAMQPLAQVSYPFVVLEDKNPIGRAWLENIMRTR